MALSLISSCEDLLDCAFLARATPSGLAEAPLRRTSTRDGEILARLCASWIQRRCDMRIVEFQRGRSEKCDWSQDLDGASVLACKFAGIKSKWLPPPPPTYEESLSDAPPNYTATDALVSSNTAHAQSFAPAYSLQPEKPNQDLFPALSQSDTKVDFTSQENVRCHANKKAKQAAKQAQMSKWNDSGDEGEKKEEGGGGGGGGGDGSANGGNGGGGGDLPAGGDGNGDDEEWDTGKKKKGKKGKKKDMWAEMEEEDEKKRTEEEAAQQAEKEAAAATGSGDATSTQANTEADWGGFATAGKKKKGKKTSPFEFEPSAAEKPATDTIGLGASATTDVPGAGDANTADDWGGFSTGKKKKGKTGKNDPMGPPPPPNATAHTAFDNINLNDEQAAPRLDLDFVTAADEKKSSGFSFGGGWGGGWGLGGGGGGGDTGRSFSAADEKKEEKLKVDVVEDSRSFGKSATTKKDKKKTSGFDFDFDGLASDGEDVKTVDHGVPALEENADPLGGVSAAKDKKIKNKKAVAAEPDFIGMPPPPPAALAKPPLEDNNPWSSLGTAKDKKKQEKGKEETESDPAVVVVPELDPVTEARNQEDDNWDAWGMPATDKKKASKKDKKAKDEPIAEEPLINVPPPPPPAPAIMDDLGRGASSKKDKRNKKGALIEEVTHEVTAPPAVHKPVAEEKDANDLYLGSGATSTKNDKKKKGKYAEPDPRPPPPGQMVDNSFLAPATTEEPRAKGEDEWASGWGTGKKDKKQKDKKNAIVEVVEPSPGASALQPDSIQESKSGEDDGWGMWGTGKKDKKKTGKKGLLDPAPPPAPTPPDQGLDADPVYNVPKPPPALSYFGETPADDTWSFAAKPAKKDGTDKDKKSTLTRGLSSDTAPKVEDTKASKKTSKDKRESPDDILAIVDEAPPPPPNSEFKGESAKEEKKASKSSGWGLFGGSKTEGKTSKEKEKDAKEKEKKEQEATEEAQRKADEEAFAAALGEDANDVLEVVDEAPPKKSWKDKKPKTKDLVEDSKPTKTESKTNKTSKDSKASGALVESPPADGPIVDVLESPPDARAGGKQADGWGFWGASLKPAKKGATPATEIGNPFPANQGPSLTDIPKPPEPAWALDGGKSATSTSPFGKSAAKDDKKDKKATKTAGSSIQDRIKALQGDTAAATPVSSKDEQKSKKDRESFAPPPPPPPPVPEPIVVAVVSEPVFEEKKSSKKSSTAKTSKKDKKEPSPPPPPADDYLVAPRPKSSTPVPGTFPGDDLFDFSPNAMSPSADKMPSKDKKSSKPAKKDGKSSSRAMDPMFDDMPPPPLAGGDLMDMMDAPAKLPTPPPEKGSRDDPKSGKKERPKVVRDQGTSSWGFWGAAPPPKKSSKAKDDSSSPTKERPPALTRSKSERKPSTRDTDKLSKSSGSDKAPKTDAKSSRPSTSRGMSFSGIFGGKPPPPSRSKSMRNSISGPPRRRDSAAVNDGMISPPPDDVRSKNMPAKAAKLLGRSKSTREKSSKRAVPDPYAIDDDDIVMVDGPEDGARDLPPEEPSSSRRKDKPSRKPKRESTYMSGGLGEAESVFVDAQGPSDVVDVVTGPDDLQFVTSPPKRAASTAKKAGLIGGLFGAFAARPKESERQQSTRNHESEDGTPRRKRTSTYDDDGTKRLRREDRNVGRSRKISDADGFTDAAPVTDAEDVEARRAERRARKEREAAELEEKAARRREREKAKQREERERQAKEDEEREARRHARRAERDSRKAAEEQAAREQGAKDEERRRRRRDDRVARDAEAAAAAAATAERPKTSERRRSHYDQPAEEDPEARRIRRDDRRLHRSTTDKPADRPRTSRRRSDYPAPVDDYFDSRNDAPAANDTSPYIKKGGDKTSSWVNSLNDDPPPPPPLEGTIVDAPVHFGAAEPLDETTARELRSKRRKDRDDDPELRRRRRREQDRAGGVRSSDGSNGDRRAAPPNTLAFNDMGGRPFDGRPSIANAGGRRGSWFKKIAGL